MTMRIGRGAAVGRVGCVIGHRHGGRLQLQVVRADAGWHGEHGRCREHQPRQPCQHPKVRHADNLAKRTMHRRSLGGRAVGLNSEADSNARHEGPARHRPILDHPIAVTAMNYRHAYHAGNFADVLKHVVLQALIESLQAKPTPFCYIDTHAGSGNYPLDGFEAGKTGEFKEGIARLHPAEKLPPLLRRWRDGILGSADNAEGLKRYPGSPLQVARLLRPGDSAQLCELHTEEACKLRDLFRGNHQVHVHERNGYEALKALVPPKEKRGLVLIDPPYEAQDAEYKLIEQALKPALLRWPTGIYAVWYPIKLRSQVQPFLRKLQHSGVKRILRAELLLHPDDSPLRLNGSGMVILNAPWNLDDSLREPLHALAGLLGQDGAAQVRLDWLLDEAGSQLNTPSPLPASRLPRGPERR